MRRYLFAALVLAAVTQMAAAAPVTYGEELCLYKTMDVGCLVPETECYNYTHKNPSEQPLGPYTVAQYLALANSGQICDVTLTITAEDVDKNDDCVHVKIKRADTGAWQELGTLTCMSTEDSKDPKPGADCWSNHRTITTFALQPLWLDGLPVELKLTSDWCDSDIVEIEKSKLCLTICPAAIPAPGALLLVSLGMAGIGWLRTKKYV